MKCVELLFWLRERERMSVLVGDDMCKRKSVCVSERERERANSIEYYMVC
jgi:hypothetical protein